MKFDIFNRLNFTKDKAYYMHVLESYVHFCIHSF